MRKSILILASMMLALVLASGVAWAVTRDCEAGADLCVGTDDPETLNGSEERDKIYGLAGGDTVLGNDGDDILNGGKDRDTVKGGSGEDHFRTSPDVDRLYGGGGNDHFTDYSRQPAPSYRDDRNVLNGGPGNDELHGHNRLLGGPGDDNIAGSYTNNPGESRTIAGGGGEDWITSYGQANDTIHVRDGVRDTVACGGGEDTVFFDDGIDSVNPVNCENLEPR